MPTEHNDLAIFKAGIALKTNTDNVHDTTPTAAQILAATAETAAGEVSPFKLGLINDASGETNMYIVISDGTNTGWLKFTKGI